jgi:hypothetical protein
MAIIATARDEIADDRDAIADREMPRCRDCRGQRWRTGAAGVPRTRLTSIQLQQLACARSARSRLGAVNAAIANRDRVHSRRRRMRALLVCMRAGGAYARACALAW